MKDLIKVIFAGLVLALIAGMAAICHFQGPMRGHIHLSTIKGDATIRYEGKHQMPYVTGTKKEAVYFALGFVHAQDRLWDMQVKRAIALGRVSEVK